MSRAIQFKIMCASGTLIWGSSPDFLACVARAKALKIQWTGYLPQSTLRVQFFYPNKKRVPSADIKAALRALQKTSIAEAVQQRLATAVVIPPARSEARTAGIMAESALVFDSAFSQASVVAPPDSPDLGNFQNVRVERLGV